MGHQQNRLCIFCGKSAAIKKSHIIPSYIFDPAKDTDPPNMLVVDKELKVEDKIQNGYYEPLLCLQCEGYFNKQFEQPCIKLIRSLPDKAMPGQRVMLEPCPRLKLFILSVLWKASYSIDPRWSISLGAHQRIIADILNFKKNADNYGIWLQGIATTDGDVLKGIVSSMATHKTKKSHCRLYSFSGMGFNFVISISRLLPFELPIPVHLESPIPLYFFRPNRISSISEIFKDKQAEIQSGP